METQAINWIKVDEQKPEEALPILLFAKKKNDAYVGYLLKQPELFFVCGNDKGKFHFPVKDEVITHWAYIFMPELLRSSFDEEIKEAKKQISEPFVFEGEN